ncbi:MAG: KOW domain-containing RNA-binding protein [Oscillospiraceae bacterium]|nr:KOW domain-containing RNA-binding protein [Oscillospiraceae bacterium]
MAEQIGQIVRSVAGHDKSELFCVVGQRDGYLLLANGKQRKAASPKLKKPGHVQPLDQGAFDHPVIRKLQNKETVSDRELRSALAAFKGGNHAWQKTI